MSLPAFTLRNEIRFKILASIPPLAATTQPNDLEFNQFDHTAETANVVLGSLRLQVDVFGSSHDNNDDNDGDDDELNDNLLLTRRARELAFTLAQGNLKFRH